VPPDYVVAPGDEVLLTIWGSVDADLRLIIDRAGRITVPRVGTVQVSGVRHMDLQDVIGRRIAQVFKNFQLSVALGQLRGIRVFVTGFVVKPGGYTVNSLSTVVSALMRAGGPAASGSFRSIELRRDGKTVTTFDLYDLLLKGDRSADSVIQAGDVIHVAAVGVQVAIIGSVNRPAVIELKPSETIEDVLRIAGGFSAVADRTRLVVERLEERNATRVAQLTLPVDRRQTLSHGDVLRAVSAVEVALPSRRQSKRVRIEGEVTRPGDYVMPEGSSILDALRVAGGLTGNAFPYATEFTRESVRITQQDNYERAIRDLETELARSTSKTRVTNNDEAASMSSQTAGATRLIDRLRGLRPSGRVVLQLDPASRDLPDLALEDGDRIFVPDRPSTVGVFGSVFNASSYLYLSGHTLGDYLRLAGGPTKGADEASVFVIHANGNVESNRQGSSAWFMSSNAVEALLARPGDSIFVPEEMNKSTFVQVAKDWTQILYQFGIGIAGIKSAIR
jgi:protein involved in polysaccharide export with SLBB domain